MLLKILCCGIIYKFKCSRSLLNDVPHVLSCLTFSRASRATRAWFLTFSCALWAALCPMCCCVDVPRTLRGAVLNMHHILHALVSNISHVLRALDSYVPCALRALMHHVPRVLHAMCPMYPSTLWVLSPYVPLVARTFRTICANMTFCDLGFPWLTLLFFLFIS